ncbi:hypothetical protein J3R83DRAFT_5398 [Lanmaoa asiatica]|nr:hypothetical protein J3R83DRAFT_5398 [Lanmaoa asiatica]
MSASNDKPTYIYKLVPYTSPVPLDHTALPTALPISTLDQNSGFIHLSTVSQIPKTLVHFFTSDPRVFVLRLAYDPLEQLKQIKWEDPKAEVCGPRPGEGLFPHLYNGLRLGREEVESIRVLERGEGGWEEAIERDEEFRAWLVY